MERPGRRDDRRQPRDDHRNHRPRQDNRSRSPPRRDRRDDRRRSPPRGPPRGGDRDYQRNRDTDRGPPPRRPGDRQPLREPLDSRVNGSGPKDQQGARVKSEKPDIKMKDEDENSDAEMQRIMGFKDFRTTKNTKVPGNDKNYGVYKVKKAEYRQYMNRQGGFNRPLSPSRM